MRPHPNPAQRATRTSLLCAWALLGASGCSSADESHGAATAAVVDGRPSTDSSVVAILDVHTGDLCTGTLIHPRIVLTAKHCVQAAGAERPGAPEDFVVTPAARLDGRIDDTLAVEAVGATRSVWYEGGEGLVGDDVAVMVLRAPADLPTRSIRRDDPSDQLGEQVTVVGYGLTPEGGNGARLEGTTRVDDVRDGLLVTGPSICKGDSGGPMIQASGEVIGVASIGSPTCGSGARGFNALTGHLPLIDAALEMVGADPGGADAGIGPVPTTDGGGVAEGDAGTPPPGAGPGGRTEADRGCSAAGEGPGALAWAWLAPLWLLMRWHGRRRARRRGRIRLQLLLLLMATLVAFAAGCSRGDDTTPGACTRHSDCSEGVCLEGRCVEDPYGRDAGTRCIDVDGDGLGAGCPAGDDCDDRDPRAGSTEICDDYDNDCDGEVDEGALSACGDCDPTCTVDYVGAGTGSGWDVDGAPSEGVREDDEGSLTLVDRMPAETHFIWIANTAEGTISKIDTRTREELARYRTGPPDGDGFINDPSRTSVNASGDVYVGNRAGLSVTKVSALGLGCADTNGDGVVTTSTGPTDVLDWGMDDCVLWRTELGDGGWIRAVAAQDVPGPDGAPVPYVWAGGWDGVVYKLDGATGLVLVETESPAAPYGFALDGRGNLWISGRYTTDSTGPSRRLGRIDTTRCVDDASCAVETCEGDETDCVKQSIPIPGHGRMHGNPHNPYGITVDREQRVWLAFQATEAVGRYDPRAPASERWTIVDVASDVHGIAADAAGWVWAAAFREGVVQLDADNPASHRHVGGSAGFSTKGMAVDFDGQVWAVNRLHDSAIVIQPGASLGSATVITNAANTVHGPYTYSDMTGAQLLLATGVGWYRRAFEGCEEVRWTELAWEADVPMGSQLVWRARTADTPAELAAADWTTVGEVPPASSPLDVEAAFEAAGIESGVLVEIEVEMSHWGTGPLPRLHSMELVHRCPPPFG